MTSKEDIRDNVIHYDDEGGGEEDTPGFPTLVLWNPKWLKITKLARISNQILSVYLVRDNQWKITQT